MATKDVKMFYAESDILKIQLKTNMYIKEYGKAGAFHLAREVIQNAIDECIDENSGGDTIHITYEELEDRLTCEDNGRGFPETDYPMDIFCTTIQSGSKFFREQGGGSSGEFGLGLTAVNALSAYYKMTSFRQKEKTTHTIAFERGVKKTDVSVPLTKKKKHGSIVSFVPSKEFLGPDTEIPYEEVSRWVWKISHLVPGKLHIKFDLLHDGQVKESNTYHGNKFEDLLFTILSGTPLATPMAFDTSTAFEEDMMNGKSKSASLNLQVVFGYDNMETYYDSYCNYTNTTEGGSHVDAVEEAICRYFQTQTKKSMTDREKEKMDILWSDVKDGLKLLINLSTNANVQFVGNAKEKINNKALLPIIKNLVNDQLNQYFEEHPNDLKNYIRIVKLNARARIEMNKVKSQKGKSNMSSFEAHTIKNYRPADNKGKKYRELFLIEGDSAGGCASGGRDPYTQAILSFRGNTANVFKHKVENILHPQTGNEEWLRYLRIIQTGWGKDFDLNKCYFDKIIIMTDADVDGLAIAAGICGFHIKVLPELVRAGKLYKAVPPLYQLVNGAYMHSKEEFVASYQDKIVKSYKIQPLIKKKALTTSEFRQFILDTASYQEDLIKIGKHYGVNKFLLERVAAYFMNYRVDHFSKEDLKRLLHNQKEVTKLMSFLQKKFPEIVLEDEMYLRGVINGAYQSVAINLGLLNRLEPLFYSIRLYGLDLIVEEKKKTELQESIGEFLDSTAHYIPAIAQRFKGLGEMDGPALWETTMNPATRVLIRLTMEDLEREVDIFNKLQRDRAEDMVRRKEMISTYHLRPTDLDN